VLATKKKIVGFHQEDHADWVADRQNRSALILHFGNPRSG
jgi:hypothetical protein